MPEEKREHPTEKVKLHPRNKHRERYDFIQLIQSVPELATFVKRNPYGDDSIDFFNPEAVKLLNKALLKHFYQIGYWDIPPQYLCPPIPGRADYIHYCADILSASNNNVVPTGKQITCLDIGVGANCIYPIIGQRIYNWTFVGSDIDPVSIASATKIIESNAFLKEHIEVRLQKNAARFFENIIQPNERFDLVMCNPPFHGSFEEAQSGTLRKISGLKQKKQQQPLLNFGGKSNELWCKGGEATFVKDMVYESKRFANVCFWFTSLISRQSNLEKVYAVLNKVGALEVKTIPMGQGNKMSRMVAWTFLTKEAQKKWRYDKW